MSIRIVMLCLAVVILWGVAAGSRSPGQEPSAPASEPAPQTPVPEAEAVLEQKLAEVAGIVAKDAETAEVWTESVTGFLRMEIFGLTLGQLALSFFILLVTLLFRGVITHLLFRRLRKLADRTKTEFDGQFLDALDRPVSTFLLLVGIYLAVLVLPMEDHVSGFVGNLFRGGTMIVAVWAALRLTDLLGEVLNASLRKRQDAALLGFVPLIKKTLKIFVLIIGVLMAVDNLGYNVTGILATLGLGTAAVALASQDTLRNGFGALMIMLDRPFKVGDWIQVGDQVDGDVEAIGLRSTKVRTWPRTVLSIPNGVLANEYINNWTRMPERRVKQVVGITYEATAEDMDELVGEIREILRDDEGVAQRLILVNFTDFGESALEILVYYFTKSVKWGDYLDVRQRINCKIMGAIQRRGLSVAFPTRTLYFEGPMAGKWSGAEYASRWESGNARAPGGSRLPGDFGPDTPP